MNKFKGIEVKECAIVDDEDFNFLNEFWNNVLRESIIESLLYKIYDARKKFCEIKFIEIKPFIIIISINNLLNILILFLFLVFIYGSCLWKK